MNKNWNLEAPTIEGPNILRRVQVNVGRTAVINCPAFGSPEPSIAWLKNGQPLIVDDRHAVLNGGRQLEISDTSVDDDARLAILPQVTYAGILRNDWNIIHINSEGHFCEVGFTDGMTVFQVPWLG